MSALRVLVTRPEPQAKSFAEKLLEAGFQSVLAPVLEIQELESQAKESAQADLHKLDQFDFVIAVSSNAVRFASDLAGGKLEASTEQNWFAVGEITAAELQNQGIPVIVPNDRFDSEGLLELKELASIEGASFAILSGVGGRRKLEESLRERGAQVDRIEVYKRKALPPESISEFEAIDVLTAMSVETLESLTHCLLARGRNELCEKPIVVPSFRVATRAFDLGFRIVRVSENATEKSLIQVLHSLASEV